MPDISTNIEEIVTGFDKANTIAFVGAGISRNSGLPIVNEIVPYILNSLKCSNENSKLILTENNNLRIPFEVFIEDLKITLSEFEELLNIYNLGQPNSNHLFLSHLIKSGKLRTIVTTNFDKLIERALGEGPMPLLENIDYQVLYKEDDLLNIDWTDNKIRIIKIHGSIEDKNDLLITINRISKASVINATNSIIKHIFSSGSHNNVLILGYSFSDAFDINPQIISIEVKSKKIFSVQHSDIIKLDSNNNVFEGFTGFQLSYNTDLFIKQLWEKLLNQQVQYSYITGDTNWKELVDNWTSIGFSRFNKGFGLLIVGRILQSMGLHSQSTICFTKALELAHNENAIDIVGYCERSLGDNNMRQGNHFIAIVHYDEALNIAEYLSEPVSIGSILERIGHLYQASGEYSKSIEFYNKALKTTALSKDKERVSSCYIGLANANESLGNYKKALHYANEALKISNVIGDLSSQKIIHGIFNSIKRSINDRQKSELTLKESLKISKQLGDAHMEIGAYNDLGVVYVDNREYSTALHHFEKSLEIATRLGEKRNVSLALSNIGYTQTLTGTYNSAIVNLESALSITKEVYDKRQRCIVLIRLGQAYLGKEQVDQSINYLKEALEIANKIKDLRSIQNSYGFLGSAYAHKKKLQKAIDYTKKGLKIAEQVKDNLASFFFNFYIGNYYLELNKKKEAVVFLDRAIQYSEDYAYSDEILPLLHKTINLTIPLNDIKKLSVYYQMLIPIYEGLKNTEALAITYLNLALTFGKLQNYNKCLENVEHGLSLAIKIDNKEYQKNILLLISTNYNLFHDKRKAKAMICQLAKLGIQ